MTTAFADTHIAPEAAAEPPLVARAVRGERGAFGLLYQRHVARVYRYVVFRVRDAAMAEDLTQEIFINAYRGIGALDNVERFGPWLLAIARNQVLNHWRAAGRAPVRAEPDAAGDPLDFLPAVDAFAALEARVAAEDLVAGAATLTDLQQEVLALRFVAGLSVRETAALMARSENAVKNLQHHALAGLRRHLDALGGEP